MSRLNQLPAGRQSPRRDKRMVDALLDNAVLKEMLEERTAVDQRGERTSLKSQIVPRHAQALFATVRELRPERCIEVGMACGVSTLSILTALDQTGGEGSLISIDPHQRTVWEGVGLTSVARAGLAKRHRLIEDFDYLALPQLLREGQQCQFAYIDGWHTFDYTLLDLFYVDRMLAVGGVVGLNDCGWPAVHKVIKFLLSHRRYEELDVGLTRKFGSRRNVRQYVRKQLLRDRSDDPLRIQKQDRYFRKLEAWEPKWNFFAEF